MISLMGGIVNGGENIIPFERGVICQDFLNRSPSCQQFKHISNANTLPTNAGSAPTFALLDCDPFQTLKIHKLGFAL